jgi:hypothetical protein
MNLGLGLQRNNYSGTYNFEIQYYVRPAGTTYGDGSGTSYANAWAGFTSINWSLLENKKLNIFGTHFERLLVQNNNVTIFSNFLFDQGIINGQSVRQCINVTSYNNMNFNGLNLINGLVENIIFENSTGNIVNDSIFDTSTNQTAQHGGFLCTVTYNNCIFKNGVDDGISSHDASTVIIANNCTFQGNVQGINSISTGIVYANNCNFISNTQDLKNDNDSQIIATGCTFRGQIVANSSQNMQLIGCTMITGETLISSVGSIIVSNCKYLDASFITSNQSNVTKVQIQRSYFEMNLTQKVKNTGNTIFKLEYCTFKHIGVTNTYAVKTAGTGTFEINNCNFIGNGNLGRGIAAEAITNVKNTIFQDLNLCVNPNGVTGIVTFDYCNTYQNTTINVNQGGGTFANTNNITTNPLFTSIATLDFRLQVGSGSIGTGTILTNATGIETADWSASTPIVTTKNQSAGWNRGAYVN